MTLAVHHLAILVADLDRAEAFYAGVLGLPVLRRWTDDDGQPRSVWLQLQSEVFLALEKSAEPAKTGAGWHCVALGITPTGRERWRDHMVAAGFAVQRETEYTMFFHDPEGNLVALSHYPQ